MDIEEFKKTFKPFLNKHRQHKKTHYLLGNIDLLQSESDPHIGIFLDTMSSNCPQEFIKIKNNIFSTHN